MEVVATGEEVGGRIGSPEPLEIRPTDRSTIKTEKSSFTNVAGASSTLTTSNSNTSMSNGTNLSSQLTHPISSLSPYHNK